MTAGVSPREVVWNKRRTAKGERLGRAGQYVAGKVVEPSSLGQLLEAVIQPGDKVALEGDNQKQANFLSRTLAGCDPKTRAASRAVRDTLARQWNEE